MSVFYDLLHEVPMPKMVKVRQKFPRPSIAPDDIPHKMDDTLAQAGIADLVVPGMRIAITVGSRGIRNIARITKELVRALQDKGALPFIVPAMGSHGGGIAENQQKIIEDFGVTEAYCGCPIRATMDTVQVGTTSEGHAVVIDRYAAEADGIIVVGRVKPHTAFRGEYESGLMKMMAIGLGKREGANACHAAGWKHMRRLIPLFGNTILQNANILFAVAIIENAFDETCMLEAVRKEQIAEREPELLVQAKALMPRLWIEETDVLIVDKIGKNISGDGMDPNITGTFATPYASGGLKSQKVAVLDVTDESHGVIIGAGMAHATTRRLFDKADLEASYINALTSTVFDVVRIPMILKSDLAAIAACIRASNEIDIRRPRVIRIADSLHMEYIYVSEALMEEAARHPNLEIVGELQKMPFDENGNLW
ncbi:lactate racemase domain-containing protein [Paenibacillus hodogayensis]|uniref:Lactate racemase domain-containing protein n=1 Tax=Paenibacillus hodogayensis TaxID=279208 RepID=A0ABV5VPR4_9BACL